MNWILKCKFFPGAWGWQLDVATLLKTIWKQFCYYYHHHHHYHYFNLAIRLTWLSQHFQQMVMAWRGERERERECVCVSVCEAGGYSCHRLFYSVLGVENLTTTMRCRLKPDAWEGAREKGGLLTIVLIKVINMTTFLIKYMQAGLWGHKRSRTYISASQHLPWMLALSRLSMLAACSRLRWTWLN